MNLEVNHEQQNEKTLIRSGESLFQKLKFGEKDNDNKELATANLEYQKEINWVTEETKESGKELIANIKDIPQGVTGDPFNYAQNDPNGIIAKRDREHGVDVTPNWQLG